MDSKQTSFAVQICVRKSRVWDSAVDPDGNFRFESKSCDYEHSLPEQAQNLSRVFGPSGKTPLVTNSITDLTMSLKDNVMILSVTVSRS